MRSQSAKERGSAEDFEYAAPFGIDCVVRIFSALCSADPEAHFGGESNHLHDDDDGGGRGGGVKRGGLDKDNEMDANRVILCLNLILVAIRESGHCFGSVSRLKQLATDSLCYLLLNFGKNTKYIMLYELCLRTYTELLFKMRSAMKLQNEMLFRMLFIRVLKSGLPLLLPSATLNVLDPDTVDDAAAAKVRWSGEHLP